MPVLCYKIPAVLVSLILLQINMKQKFFAFGLSVAFLLAQNAFVFSQNAGIKTVSNDDVIGLFDDADAVAVVQVKKIIADTAPMLLGAHPETLDKIKAAMKEIENETGVDPYALDKVYLGMNLGNFDGSFMIVLKTNASANQMIDKMFQAQIVKSKFAAEINPLKNRVDDFERTMKPIKETVIPMSLPAERDNETLDTFEKELGMMKIAKADQPAYKKLKTDIAEMKKLFAEHQALLETVYNLGDIPERLEAVKKQINAISGNDPQRAAKIAAADKTLAPLEKEFTEKRVRMVATDEMKVFASFSMEDFPRIGGPPIEGQSEVTLFELQTAVAERIENLKTLNETMSQKIIEPSEQLKQMDARSNFVVFPQSEISTRKDETLGGKKLVAVTTERKFANPEQNLSNPVTNYFLVFDEQTLIIGNREALAKATEPKIADANRLAKNMIARSPDALAAFGINFRNQDMSGLADVFGEQKNAWQITGALDSGGSDISLTAAFERSEFPAKISAKKPGELPLPKAPEIPANDEIKKLVESMFKSMNGIEAKITVRFDKQKTAEFVETAPKLLERILKR